MKTSKMFSAGVVLSVCLFTLWGCPKKAELSSVPEAPPSEHAAAARAEAARAEALAREEKERAVREEAKRAEEAEEAKKRAASAEALKPIFFDYDQAFISDEAKAVLEAHAGWLMANPEVAVRIEGNCDERGTKEYNVALGQRRAASAKKYLTDLGIAEGRITLLSYGREKPQCLDPTEACWQKNRRADFVVVAEINTGSARQ